MIREVDDALVQQAAEEHPVVEDPGLQRCEEVRVGGGREGVAGGVVVAVGAVQVRHEDDAAAGHDALHLAGEQSLVPDVGEGIAQKYHREPVVRERQRAVGVAADGLAIRGQDAGGEPELPEVDVGEDRARARRLAQQDAGEMARAAAEVEGVPERRRAAPRTVRCAGAGSCLRVDGDRWIAGRVGMPAVSQRVEQRLDEQTGRVGESMEEVVRLGIPAEHAQQLAIRRSVRAGGQLAERVEPRSFEAEQRVQGVVATPCLQRVHGVPRGVVGDEHRDSRDHRKRAALATQNAGFDAVSPAVERGVLDYRQARAAERAAEDVESLDQHGGAVRPPPGGRSPAWRGPADGSGGEPRSSRNVRPAGPAAARR